MTPMPLHKGMIIVLGPLGDNFYADEILTSLLKLQNVNKGRRQLLISLCETLSLYALVQY